MVWKCIALIVSVFWIQYGTAESADKPQGFDLVTMKNGDIFNGTITSESFGMETGFGLVSIPLDLTSGIRLGGSGTADTLNTAWGDIFRGRLVQTSITMLRVLDPTLPLTTADIADISFTPRQTRRRELPAPDTLETVHGDRFTARVVTRDFMLRGADSIQLINRKDIFLMEIALSEDGDKVMSQITLNGGGKVRGHLMTRRILVADRYGDELGLETRSLVSLAFAVNHRPGTAPRFNYRKRIEPAAIIRDRMRDRSAGPEMIALRGGSYRRGDLQGDGDSDEKPAKSVTLKPFAIGLYEVSFDEYDRFCESTGRDKPDDEGVGRGRHPVVNVNWDSAREYTDWLSRQTGERYRLPTDAEWEYAARGGTDTRYWWGQDIGDANANCSGCGGLWDGQMASRSGRFPANPFGLHDTAGNVFEWVEDCWYDSFEHAPEDGSALQRPGCVMRVIRSGAWSFPPEEVRPANRWRDFHSRRSDDTGFRLVRELSSD